MGVPCVCVVNVPCVGVPCVCLVGNMVCVHGECALCVLSVFALCVHSR